MKKSRLGPESHTSRVLAALVALGGEADVAAIAAAAREAGLITANTRGLSHRVRTELQRLKALRLAAMVRPGRWRVCSDTPHEKDTRCTPVP
jgi:hypothetical protein